MERSATTTTAPNLYDVAIVGAGIAGMATAIGLYDRGVKNIIVFEKATQLAPVGASIAIFSNGLRALEYLSANVAKKVQDSCIPIEKMVLKDLQGNVIREKKPPTNVNYMVWYLLQQYLAEGLPSAGGSPNTSTTSNSILQLGHAVESFRVDESDGNVTITALKRNNNDTSDPSSTNKITIRTRVLVGTDGIHSPIRQGLFGEDDNATTNKFYHGKVSWRAVLPASSIQNPPPTGLNVTFQGDEEGKLFSYRETAQGILTVTSMACCDASQLNYRLSPDQKKEQMMQIFAKYPDEVQNVLQQISPQAIHMDPIHDIDVLPAWSKKGVPVIVIGDAAHAMSPSLGQGANQSLESACILVHALVKELNNKSSTTLSSSSSSPESIAACLEQVWQSRLDRVRRIHAASRARSINNNKSSKAAPIDMHSQELKKTLQEIDNWHAPVD